MSESTDDATGVLIVMAHAPEGVSDADFHAWFKGHQPEILSIPCFTAARLLDLTLFDSPPELPLPYRYMAIYDYVGTPESAMQAIGSSRAAGEMDLPEWFDDFEQNHCLVSWTGVPA